MNQRRRWRFVDVALQSAAEAFQRREAGARQAPGVEGAPTHGEQALLAKEIQPALGLRIGLRQGADQGVALQAETRCGNSVQRGKQIGGMTLGLAARRPGVLNELNDQQLVFGVKHRRRRQVAVGAQVVQHPAFQGKGGFAGGRQLGDTGAAVRQCDLVDFGNTAAGQGRSG